MLTLDKRLPFIEREEDREKYDMSFSSMMMNIYIQTHLSSTIIQTPSSILIQINGRPLL